MTARIRPSEAQAEHRYLTIDEYLLLEDRSMVRHEFVAGERYAFAGGTSEHSLIAMSIGAALLSRARGSGCRVYGSDMLLRIADDAAYYPDIMVVCDPEDVERQYKSRPCLVVEVLSEGMRMIDRREKLMAYRRIESLQVYMLVHQDEVYVERLWLDERRTWQREHIHAGGTVQIACLPGEIPIEEFYSQLTEMAALPPRDA